MKRNDENKTERVLSVSFLFHLKTHFIIRAFDFSFLYKKKKNHWKTKNLSEINRIIFCARRSNCKWSFPESKKNSNSNRSECCLVTVDIGAIFFFLFLKESIRCVYILLFHFALVDHTSWRSCFCSLFFLHWNGDFWYKFIIYNI